MISRIELKAKARELAFKNKWAIWKPVLIYMIAFGIINAILGGNNDNANQSMNGTNFILWIIELVTAFLVIGYYKYLLSMVRKETFTMKDILTYKTMLVSALLLTLLISIFTFLWTLLLIVPGIIAALSYSQAMYIKADNVDMEPMDVIAKSKQMMKGHKWELFVLGLSFIGWILLCAVTLGIALIWFLPYSYITFVLYYEELKKIAN